MSDNYTTVSPRVFNLRKVLAQVITCCQRVCTRHYLKQWWPSCSVIWCNKVTMSGYSMSKQFPSLLTRYHCSDVIMSTMASQITGVSIVCSTVGSSADQRKHQSSASLAFMWGIHRWPVNSLHKRPVTRKMFPFDDVIMINLSKGKCASTSPIIDTMRHKTHIDIWGPLYTQ